MNSKEKSILEAALRLFADRGYDGTTMPMIAEKANVGAGTIYRYFSSKEQLVNILYGNCIQDFSEAIRKDFPYEEESVRRQFRYIFMKMASYGKRSPDGFYFVEKHTYHHCLEESSHVLFQEFLNFFREFLDKGIRFGIFRDLPVDALIAIVYGAFSGLYKFIIVGEVKETVELIEKVEKSCWDAIRK